MNEIKIEIPASVVEEIFGILPEDVFSPFRCECTLVRESDKVEHYSKNPFAKMHRVGVTLFHHYYLVVKIK